jgi:hypothetical protein
MASAAAAAPKLWYYKIVTDVGAAPHISEDYLTLTICKPRIREWARPGDYVMALVAVSGEIGKELLKSKAMNTERKHFYVAYIFKVGDKIPYRNYESWCAAHAPSKISCAPDYSGNCQYFGPDLNWRPGPHSATHRNLDIGGKFSLISDLYGAWTSRTPHMLTDEEIGRLGLTNEKLMKLGIGQHNIELADESQIAELHRLISMAPNKTEVGAAAPSGKKCCGGTKKGGKRRSHRRTRRSFRK